MRKKLKPKTEELKGRRQLFLDYYFGEAMCNGTKAAILAGYSPHTAAFYASQILKKLKETEAFKVRLASIGLTQEEVRDRLAAHATGDLDDFLDEHGNFDLEKARRFKKTKLIKKLKIKPDGEIEFELYDAQSALNTFAKMHGMLTPQAGEEEEGETIKTIVVHVHTGKETNSTDAKNNEPSKSE